MDLESERRGLELDLTSSLLRPLVDEENDDGVTYISDVSVEYPVASHSHGFIGASNQVIFTFLCFVAIGISYADRSNISVAIIEMQKQYEWSDDLKGWILGVFYVGYLSTQIPGGWISHKYKGSIVCLASIFVTSVFTLAAPLGAQVHVAALMVCRILLGVGEGLLFPAIHRMIATHVPVNIRAIVVTIVTSACYLGNCVAMIASPKIIGSLGWEYVFYIFGAGGLLFIPMWLAYHSTGWCITGCGVHEPKLVDVLEEKYSVPWKKLLTSHAVWAIMLAQYTNSYGFYVFLNFMPTYFEHQFNIKVEDLGMFTFGPYLAQGVVAISAGFLSDALTANNIISVPAARRTFQLTGQIGPALFLLILVVFANTPTEVSLLITAALGTSACTCASVSVNQLDIAPRHAGIVFALGNTAGQLPGLVGSVITSALGDQWWLIFTIAIVHYVVGAVSWVMLARYHVVIE